MTKLDRSIQKQLLQLLADRHPDWVMPEAAPIEREALRYNASYLCGHELIEMSSGSSIGGVIRIGAMRATSKGLDFLEDDGGLTAILGVVTVRFDAPTLKALIARSIDQSDAPEGRKASIKKHVEDLPEHLVKSLIERLLESTLNRLPSAWQTIEAVLSGLIP